jgi:hypothetical protein
VNGLNGLALLKATHDGWKINDFPIYEHLFEYIGTQFPPPSSLLYGKMGSITLFFSNGNIIYDTTFYAWDIGRQFTLFHFLLQWEWAFLWDLKGRGLSWAVKGKNKKYKIPFCRVTNWGKINDNIYRICYLPAFNERNTVRPFRYKHCFFDRKSLAIVLVKRLCCEEH